MRRYKVYQILNKKKSPMTKTNMIGNKILQINFWHELFKLEYIIIYKILAFNLVYIVSYFILLIFARFDHDK